MIETQKMCAKLTDLVEQRRSVREYSGGPIGRAALERIVGCAQGQSAPGRRNAPSAHALYPLRLFALINRLDDRGCAPGFYSFDTHHSRRANLLGAVSLRHYGLPRWPMMRDWNRPRSCS